jgi:hypothetical protein
MQSVRSYSERDSKFSPTGRTMDVETSRVRRGTALDIAVLDTSKTIAPAEAAMRKVFAAKRELWSELEMLGMKLPMPESIKTSLSADGADSRGLHVEEELETTTAYFYIHSGMRGWYVMSESASSEVIISVDERFPKYFTRESAMSFVETKEKLSVLAAHVEKFYAKFVGSEPDERYRVKPAHPCIVEETTSSMHTLADFARITKSKK